MNVDRYYVGVRTAHGTQVTVHTYTGRVVGPLPQHPRHSPGGFEWGSIGSGPAELARCLLIDVFGDDAHCHHCNGAGCRHCDRGIDRRVRDVHQAFMHEIVVGWTSTRWLITADTMIDWLAHTERHDT